MRRFLLLLLVAAAAVLGASTLVLLTSKSTLTGSLAGTFGRNLGMAAGTGSNAASGWVFFSAQNSIATGTAQTCVSGGGVTCSSSVIILSASDSAADGFYTNKLINLTGGLGYGQNTTITSYTSATKEAIVSPAFGAGAVPNASSTYNIGSGYNELHRANYADGSGDLCISCTSAALTAVSAVASGHGFTMTAMWNVGKPSVRPQGDWVAVIGQVATLGSSYADIGFRDGGGYANALFLAAVDGSTWTLVSDIHVSSTTPCGTAPCITDLNLGGTINPKWSYDGTRLGWSSQTSNVFPAAYHTFNMTVGSFTLTSGVPGLSLITASTPTGGGNTNYYREMSGFSNDLLSIYYSCNDNVTPNSALGVSTTIFTPPNPPSSYYVYHVCKAPFSATTNVVSNASYLDAPGSPSYLSWKEFFAEVPGDPLHAIWMQTPHAYYGTGYKFTADLWYGNSDMSNPHQLTFEASPWSSLYKNIAFTSAGAYAEPHISQDGRTLCAWHNAGLGEGGGAGLVCWAFGTVSSSNHSSITGKSVTSGKSAGSGQ